MFDLETALHDWKNAAQRSGLAGRPSLSANELEELEDHLREEFGRLVAGGQSPTEAWSATIAKLGSPTEISQEFAKINRLPNFDRVMLALIIAVGIFYFDRGMETAWPHPEKFHVIRIGYAMFVLGAYTGVLPTAIAAYEAIRRVLSPTPNAPLTRAAVRLIGTVSIFPAFFINAGIGMMFVVSLIENEDHRKWVTFLHPPATAVICISLVAAAITARSTRLAPKIAITCAAVAGGLIMICWLAPISKPVEWLVAYGGGAACVAIAAMSFRLRATLAAA